MQLRLYLDHCGEDGMVAVVETLDGKQRYGEESEDIDTHIKKCEANLVLNFTAHDHFEGADELLEMKLRDVRKIASGAWGTDW